jgi:hypothetical protein
MIKQLKVAMITGHHEYEVVPFQKMLRSLPDLDIYPQHLEDFVWDTTDNKNSYDVIAFYNFQQTTPRESEGEFGKLTLQTLNELQNTGQGLVFLHHALTAFPQWEYWSTLCGLDNKRKNNLPESEINQNLIIQVTDRNHPITSKLENWEMIDETYSWDNASSDCDILLTTTHSESMATIAWTKTYGNSRIFSFQSGHDSQTFENDSFRTVLARGIKWVAKLI